MRRYIEMTVVADFGRRSAFGVTENESKANAELFILAQQAVTMLETLVNLHDGLDCGGDGITEDDWELARKLLGITKNIE